MTQTGWVLVFVCASGGSVPNEDVVARGGGDLRAINGHSYPSDEAITEVYRRAAEELVAREKRANGSRMTSYHVVATRIGVTAHWLRRFIGRDGRCKPSLHVGLRIYRLAYETLVSRVMSEVEKEQEKVEALLRELNAFSPSSMDAGSIKAGAQQVAAATKKDGESA